MVRFRSYQTTVAAGPGAPAHAHDASLDEKGDGQTGEEGKHTHRVSSGVVQDAMGHTHELLDYQPRRTIGRRQFGNKGASEPLKRKNKDVPAGVGPQGTGQFFPQPPPLPPMESVQRMYEEYGFVGKPYARVGWDSKREAFDKYAVLEEILGEGDTLLDIGCGTGLLYEWLVKRLQRKTGYYGVDRSLPFLKEFSERFPEATNRLRHVDALVIGEDVGEYLPREHYDVSTAFGMTADMGSGEDQYKRLHHLGSFMRRVSDIQVIEFWDRLRFKDRDAGILEGTPPSTWSPAKVKKVFANVPHELVRPLSPNGEDFAVVAWHPDVIQ